VPYPVEAVRYLVLADRKGGMVAQGETPDIKTIKERGESPCRRGL
jgi:hypothetical protein